jgi:hypothetical protein
MFGKPGQRAGDFAWRRHQVRGQRATAYAKLGPGEHQRRQQQAERQSKR